MMKRLGLALLFLTAPAQAAEREDLWHVVHYVCGGMNKLFGAALPCLKLDREAGYAILRAPGDSTRIILTPTRHITGIESPALLRPDAPPYWAYAWEHRNLVTEAAPRPLGWGDLAMAVNARAARSQDQLHIHVGCVDPRIKAALAAQPPKTHWTTLEQGPWAGKYRMRRIELADLQGNLFKRVADEAPGARGNMQAQGVAVIPIGSERGKAFALLDNPQHGHPEQLLDLSCGE